MGMCMIPDIDTSQNKTGTVSTEPDVFHCFRSRNGTLVYLNSLLLKQIISVGTA